jgi:hypothetical protein
MDTVEMGVRAYTGAAVEGELYPKLKASLRFLIDHESTKPECFSSNEFYLRFMDHVGLCTAPVSLDDQTEASLVIFRLYLASFASEPFFNQLSTFLQELAEKSLGRQKIFVFRNFEHDTKILSLGINIAVLCRATGTSI